MCNTCIFNCSETPAGPEQDIQIISLMALQLKHKFDSKFSDYKDNLTELTEYLLPLNGQFGFSSNLEAMVTDFFSSINDRLSKLETAVINKLEQHPEISSLQKSISDFLFEVESWDDKHVRAKD